MTAVNRKGCILPPSMQESSSIMTQEKVQRLRVNRVAFIQSLRVEHILDTLLSGSVITEEDKEAVLAVKGSQEKARVLIDLLPTQFPGKSKDWYGKFRDALRHPDTRSKEVKRKYEMLVEFLDNTIINVPRRPKTPVSKSDENVREKPFPRYQPLPRIAGEEAGAEAETGERERTEKGEREWAGKEEREAAEKGENESPEHTHKDNVNKATTSPSHPTSPKHPPGNIPSRIVLPQEHFDTLLKGMTAEDLTQLEQERSAYTRILCLETLNELERRGLANSDHPLCLSKSLREFLADPNLYHYYFKYLTQLRLHHNVHLLADVCASFCNHLQVMGEADNDEQREQLTDIGFKLYRLSTEYGETNKAEFVLLALMQYLSTCSKLENWMALWEGLVSMMCISNANVDFKQTDANYHLVRAMGEKIKNMSFGLDLLDESTMFSEMSVMMREQGSIQAAYKWARKAIEEVEEDNEAGIIDVLCSASAAYASNWDVKGAKELAIEAIKRAKCSFGIRHPLYVKALLAYVNFAIDFQPDKKAVEIAKVAVGTCEKIYGGTGSYQSALAHQALAKALMAAQQWGEGREYHTEAVAAWRCALDTTPQNHPRLASFKYTLAQSNQWRAVHSEEAEEERGESLVRAEAEVKGARVLYKAYWGTFSLKVAQCSSLLAQIHAKANREEAAEEEMRGSVSMYQLIVPASSPALALAKATLAMFLASTQRPQQAIPLLSEALNAMDGVAEGEYIAWVHSCHENLVALLEGAGDTEGAGAARDRLSAWLASHPRPADKGANLGVESDDKPLPLHVFKQQFFGWETAAQIVQRGLRNLKANLGKIREKQQQHK